MDPSATLKLNDMIFSVCFFSKMFSLHGHFFFEKCIMFCFRCHLVIARCAARRMLTTKWPRRLGLEITRMCETRRAAVSRMYCLQFDAVCVKSECRYSTSLGPPFLKLIEYLTPKLAQSVAKTVKGNPSYQFHDELPFDRISWSR